MIFKFSPSQARARARAPGRGDDYYIIMSDSLNISPRARWVVCPLGRTRGHGRRFIFKLSLDPPRPRRRPGTEPGVASESAAAAAATAADAALSDSEPEPPLGLVRYCDGVTWPGGPCRHGDPPGPGLSRAGDSEPRRACHHRHESRSRMSHRVTEFKLAVTVTAQSRSTQ